MSSGVNVQKQNTALSLFVVDECRTAHDLTHRKTHVNNDEG
jgi:hypothetical protein